MKCLHAGVAALQIGRPTRCDMITLMYLNSPFESTLVASLLNVSVLEPVTKLDILDLPVLAQLFDFEGVGNDRVDCSGG